MFGSGDLGMGIRFVLTDMASNVAAKIGGSLKTLTNQVNATAGAVQAAASRMQTGLFGVALAVGLLTAPFIAGISAANKFEKTMSEVFAKGGARDKSELEKLRQTALSIKNLRLSNPQQRAEAMVEFAKGGFEGIQIERGLDPAQNLSAAGDISVSKAVEVVSNQMHQFNLASKDFQHIADVNVLAANKTAMSVEDMSQAMKFAGPNAKALGQGLEETAATLMLSAQGGLRGSIAARAFYNALTRLADPTNKQMETMKQFGIDPFAGKNRSFVGVTALVEQLKTGLNGATGEDTAKALSRIIGSDALKNLNSVLNTQIEVIRNGKTVYLQGAEALKYYWDMQMKASEGIGAAAETAKIMRDNLYGDLQETKNLLGEHGAFTITVGKAFQEGLRPVVQGLNHILIKLTEFAKTPFGQAVIKWTGYLAALVAGLVAFGFVITVIIPAMGAMIAASIKLMVVISPYVAIFAAITYALFKLTTAMDEFSQASLDAAGNLEKPMTMWQRVAGFFAGMAEIWQSWDGDTFSLSEDLHDKLKANGDLDTVLNTGTYLVRFKEFMKGIGEVTPDFSGLISSFDDLTDSILNFLGLFGIGEKASGSAASWKAVGKQLGEVFSNTLVSVITLMTEGINKFVQSLTYIIAVIQEFQNIDNEKKGGFQWRRVANRVAGRDAEDDGAQGTKFNLSKDEQKAKDIATAPASVQSQMIMRGIVDPTTLMELLKEEKDKKVTIEDKSTIIIQADGEKFFKAFKKHQMEEFERDSGNND